MPHVVTIASNPSHSKQAGYTLLVVSVLIMTSSILLFAFFKPKPVIHAEQIAITHQRLDTIEAALKAYYHTIGHLSPGVYALPCPAPLNLTTTSTDFGIATPTCSSCTDGVVDGTNDGVFCTDTTKILRGAIPVRTLSLSDEIAYDGFGRLFSYVLDANMATAFTKMSPTNLIITATNLDYPTITPYDRGNQFPIAFIVSHGPNWGGSFGSSGVSIACPFLEYNGENCDNDEVYFHDRWRKAYDGNYSNITRLMLFPPVFPAE